jgi:hypothetical protein
MKLAVAPAAPARVPDGIRDARRANEKDLAYAKQLRAQTCRGPAPEHLAAPSKAAP